MKLRIRSQSSCSVIQVLDGSVTLEQLTEQVRLTLNIPQGTPVTLSLNGSDPLCTDDDDSGVTLSDAGIVSGDLIHVLVLPDLLTNQTSGQVKSASSDHQMDTSEEQGVIPVYESSNSAPCANNMDVAHNNAAVNSYMLDTILLRHASAGNCPQTLCRACQELKPNNHWERLCVALHVLMTELGFRPQVFGGAAGADEGGGYVWRVGEGGGARFEYGLIQCGNAVRCQLVCVPIGNKLVVHGILKVDGMQNETVHKTKQQLNVQDYINVNNSVGTTSHMYTVDEVKRRYRCEQLPNLSRLFKDITAYPLHNFALTETGQPFMNTLVTLPFELQLMICEYLHVESLIALGSTCWSFRHVCFTQCLWRLLYVRKFGKRDDMSLSQNWLQLYKEKHILLKHEEESRRAQPRFSGPRVPLPTLPPLPFSPYLPGFFIGGDYDLYPNIYQPIPHHDPYRIFRPVPGVPTPWPPPLHYP